MSSTPAISILTPVWNGLPYIKETVASVLAQEFQNWEMVIADNASDDGTSEYLRSLTDPRIKVHRHSENVGVYRNIYFLFNHASAPIWTGLCADDYFYNKDSLQQIVDEWAKAGPEVGFMTFNWKSRQMKHNRLMKFSQEILPHTLGGLNAAFAFFLFGNFPGNFSEISSRVPLVTNEHFLYHVKYSADYEFWLRLIKRNSLYLSDNDVVYIRRHDRVAATYVITKGEYHEESIEIYEKIIDELSEYSNRRKLIAFYNIEICSYHLRDALKSALKGRFTAFKSFMRLKSPIFWPTGLQLLGCLPFALSESLRYPISVMLAKNILKTKKTNVSTANEMSRTLSKELTVK
ncbi:MAG: glycosyltransferase family 2 protein [Chryseolinea sp.]